MSSPDRPETPTSVGDLLARTRRRAEQLRRRRRAALIGAAAAVIAVAVPLGLVLGNRSHPGRDLRVTGGPTSVSPLAPTTTHAPTTSPVTAGSTATAASTTTTTGAVTIPVCATSQLSASLANPSGAAGSMGYDLVFVNTGHAACSLAGYPGVSYVTGLSGTTVGAPAQRDNTGPAVTITLAPGRAAHSLLIEVNSLNYPPNTCQLTGVNGLRIRPPNQTATLFVPQTTQACANPADPVLGIGPLQAGS